jgi:hypothetical protein
VASAVVARAVVGRTALARVAAVLAGLMAVAATTVWPAGAAPRPVRDCTATSGATLVVDFAHWGGPLLRACGSTPTTGYRLLNQGGWHTAGTEHDGPAFICRIGYAGYHHGTQYPTLAQQACVNTPPASAYWTYWEAGPGQRTWSYNQLGAVSYRPGPGSISLWIFGGTNLGGTVGSAVPAITPTQVRALISDAAATMPPGSPPIINAQPVSAASPAERGSYLPALITLAIVVVLAAGATASIRRRRRVERAGP